MLLPMLKSLTAVATAVALSTTAAAPALANTPQGAQNLAAAIVATGTNFYVGSDHACGKSFAGAYQSETRTMLICADGKQPAQFTAYEQDTLRHEAVHLIQDCLGEVGDGRLEQVMDLDELKGQIIDSETNASAIIESYGGRGADNHTILLELEAWSSAPLFTNQEIADAVRGACRVR